MNRATCSLHAFLLALLISTTPISSFSESLKRPSTKNTSPSPVNQSQKQFKILQQCQKLAKKKRRPPIINLLRAVEDEKNPSMYTIFGTIDGVCLKEAGYYEQGELQKAINLTTSPYYQSISFTLTARKGRTPEIRVGTITGDGRSSPVDLDELVAKGDLSKSLSIPLNSIRKRAK